MSNITPNAIKSCNESVLSYCKFIAPNDTKATKAHQSGFLISRNSWSLFFDSPGVKGSNKDVYVTVKWQSDFTTNSRFTYYGQETRNEYRLTRFGRNFPFREEENIGDLLIIAKTGDKYYEAYVLKSDDEIEEFFSAFGISATETNRLIPKAYQLTVEQKVLSLFEEFIRRLKIDFPPTGELAKGARNIFMEAYNHTGLEVLRDPDSEILSWISAEFDLFKSIENDRYSKVIETPFPSVEDLIITANRILNRRKSRAGKSLEHHLAEVFNIWQLPYSSQPTTEQNKKPDFIFPSIERYWKEPLASKNLLFLGVKTTCKDRWRQVVSEADKIPQKHLFTLQQGISSNQLREMKEYGITLVVPGPYLQTFPKNHIPEIWTLSKFLQYAKEKYGS